MNALRLVSKPDLNTTFNLNEFFKHNQQKEYASNENISNKITYHSIWSRGEENECKDGGSVNKDISLFPRDHFDPSVYKTNDDTTYRYYHCDTGNKKYEGSVNYHVDDFTKFDYTFGSIPLGTFSSSFNYMSIETATQKVTLDGTIKYEASASYTPEPNAELKSLQVKYSTVSDFTVTVEDKSNGETTKLVYNGVLEQIDYSKNDKATNASAVNIGVIGNFVYHKSSNYTLRVEYKNDMATVGMNDNILGTTEENGELNAPHSAGLNYGMSSILLTSTDIITSSNLADGTVRYILDLDANTVADANIVEGTPVYTLPTSEYDLMQGVVVIGFDSCPPTKKVRKALEELNIPYNYVDIDASQQNSDILKWFFVSGVPYVGVNGNYFTAAMYSKGHWAALLKQEGFNISDADLQQAYEDGLVSKSAAMWYQEKFDTLQTKVKHTAFAVANDLPFIYTGYMTWGQNSVNEAKEHALKGCEEYRTKQEGTKGEIKSECRLYSVDGLKQ